MPRKEVFVGSLTTKSGDNLSLTRVLEAKAIRGKIKEVHVVLGEKQNGYDILSRVADIAFGSKIEPADIKTNGFSIEEADHSFAEGFGFVILPIASAKLIEGRVEAWMSPALVAKKHPLVSGSLNSDSAVVITIREIYKKRIDYTAELIKYMGLSESDREPLLRGILDRGLDKDVREKLYGTETTDSIIARYLRAPLSSYYVRLTVQNDPGVLASVCEQFGSANISIRMVRQPEVEEGNKIAQLAFVLHPCETKALEECVSSIQNLDVCVGVGSVLGVVE